MRRALVGHTGLIGSTLARQGEFDEFYNSSNIGDICGKRFDSLICAGAPGSKWRANKYAYDDWRSVSRLVSALREVRCDDITLISTVDVYPCPDGVCETDVPRKNCLHPYGTNRLMLEMTVAPATIVRLPGVFGQGLKKNAIFDLMHQHETEKIPENAVFQWYPLRRLTEDIGKIEGGRPRTVHLVSEPVVMRDIRDRFFPGLPLGEPRDDAPRYNVLSVNGYALTRGEVFAELAQFLSEAA